MKRALIIVASIIFLLGIGFGIYLIFGPKDPSLTASDGVSFDEAGDAPLPIDPTEGATGPVPAGEEIAPRLIRITESPIALGMAIFELPSQVVPAETASGTPQTLPGDVEIRYIDRASGNIYAYRFYDRTLERIANRTLPGVQEASWLDDGSLAYTRFISGSDGADRVETYALPASGEGGYFLERGLSQASVIGTTTLFTLMPSTAGSVGTVSSADGTNSRTLFSSPLASLIVHLSNGPFMAHTKASASLDGYAFTIGAGGQFSRILGPLRGLSILPSPSGSLVLYTYMDGRTLRMSVLDRADGTSTALPIATLAEKCTWSSDSRAIFCGVPRGVSGALPDEWYQGVISFSDRIWRIDMDGRVATLLIDPATSGEATIDMTGLKTDGRNDILTFRNRIDGSLWAYDL